jgi:hypothetical protein
MSPGGTCNESQGAHCVFSGRVGNHESYRPMGGLQLLVAFLVLGEEGCNRTRSETRARGIGATGKDDGHFSADDNSRQMRATEILKLLG